MVVGEGAGGDPGAEQQSAGDEPPAWFRAYVEQTDKRFEGLAAKLRGPAASPAAEPAATSAPQGQDVSAIVAAAMQYGELRSGLSESARGKLDSLQEQGLSYAQLTAVAEALRSVRAPANGSPVPPPGRAANAAPNSIAPQIQSISELRALRAKNPDVYKAWIQDPSNDIGKLANR